MLSVSTLGIGTAWVDNVRPDRRKHRAAKHVVDRRESMVLCVVFSMCRWKGCWCGGLYFFGTWDNPQWIGIFQSDIAFHPSL